MDKEENSARESSPGLSTEEMQVMLEELVRSFEAVDCADIPKIDLYMDQVTSFMEQHLSAFSRDPENDKILTKTMINNYVKNGVLMPPVKKKYSTDQMLFLIMIFYLKSFLTIRDIEALLRPVRERYASGKEDELSLGEVYEMLRSGMEEEKIAILSDTRRLFEASRSRFSHLPDDEEAEELARYDAVSRICLDIFIKKLYLERLIDETSMQGESRGRKNKQGI